MRLLHRDLFGHGEALRLRAGFGGIYQQEYEASIDTGRLLGGRSRMGLSAEYEIRQNGRFSGVGNADRVSREEADIPIGVFDPEQSVRTRYRRRVLLGRLHATQSPTDELTLRATHVWRWRKYSVGQLDGSGTPWITEVYERDRLLGFGGGLVSVYNELYLRWNHRIVWHPLLPVALPSQGIRVDAWAGWQTGLEADPSQLGRYGLDVQPFIELFGGDRVLRLRLRYAAVVGPRRNIPFEDWPNLGGSTLLRGYGRERFRGRATLLSTVEYRYPVQPNISSYIFVDAGRAYAALDAFTLEGMRVGFGGGLLLYTESTFLIGLQMSSSIDGGVQVNVKVNTTDGTERTY